ncbi:MAG: LamG domain-containing protein, partial [Candidatus Marinimicrobia bacterium]|nr:LamG domain-containing protein [Candidatus Neomarinimicrobiota bacterium]
MRTKNKHGLTVRRLAWSWITLMGLILPSLLFAQTSSSEYYISQHSDVLGGQAVLTNTITNPSGPASMTITAGQVAVGRSEGGYYSTDLGMWSFYIKEPDSPIVSASDGEAAHPAYITISAVQDVLSPPATGDISDASGFPEGNWVLTRDGEWKANIPIEDPSFDDGQSIYPGQLYNYGVTTTNKYGESDEGFDAGFTLPNGKISGRVFTPGPTPGAPWTPTGNPVADVEVSLSPIRGKSARLDGADDYISIDSWYDEEITESFTIEMWINIDLSPSLSTIMDMGQHFQLYHDDMNLKASIGSVELSTALPTLQNWHHVACVMDTNTFILYLNGDSVTSAPCTVIPDGDRIRVGKNRLLGQFFNGWVDDIRVWTSAREQLEIERNKDRALFGDEDGLVGYWKFDEGMNNISYDATSPRELATLEGAQWSDEIPAIKLSAFTEVDGSYEIRNVWYDAADDNGTTYTVTPYKENHAFFTPNDDQATVSRNDPEATDVKFLDESLFSVTGYLTYANTNCAVVRAEILADSVSTRPETFTNAYGEFSLDFEPNTGAALSVRFGGYFLYDTTTFSGTDYIEIDTSYLDAHTFHLDGVEQNYVVENIEADIANVDFEDVYTDTLFLNIGGGTCMYPIGDASITLRVPGQGSGYCYEETFSDITTGEGYQAITGLPPLEFQMLIDHNHTSISFENQDLSLVDSSAHMELMYKADLAISFSEYPWGEGCEIITQFESDSLLVFVYEEYGGYTLNSEEIEVNQCPLTGFEIQAFDDWTGIYTEKVWLDSPDGTVWYNFTPKAPNTLDGGDHPFQKQLMIAVTDELGREATWDVWATITGITVTDGTDFVSRPAKTTLLPFFVLRDPPGDLSYSYLAEEQTICRTISLETVNEEASSGFVTENLGLDMTIAAGWTVPFVGTSITWETEVDVTAELTETWGSTITDVSQTETEVCFTTSELYQTNGDGYIVGGGGDIFVGAGLNVTYSRIVDLSVNEACEVSLDSTYGLSDMTGFHSFYVYSDYHIRNNLIPDLETIYSNENTSPDDTSALGESLRYWNNLLATNDSAKVNALPTDATSNTGEMLSNISFDALASYEYSTTTDSSVSHGTEITISEWDDFGGAAGVEFNGVGIVGGGNTSTTIDTTTGEEDEESYSRTMGFFLGDDDPGDAFTLDLKRDPVWGMPVFDLIAGQTSNPWEENTFKRQWCSLSIDPPVSVDNEPDEQVLFDLTLGNLSETGETWAYSLSAWNESNPDGLLISVNGVSISGTELSFEIDAGESVNATMVVERGPLAFEYDDLTLEFGPPGELEIADILGEDTQNAGVDEFTVRFIAPCSEVTLAVPEYDGWLINQASADESGNDSLQIVFANFDTLDLELEDIVLEYTRVNEEEWFSGAVLTGIDSLGQDFWELYWNTSSVPEGEYYIRAHAGCRLRDSYSDLRQGTIDRSSPEILGVPQPMDAILNSNDEIILTLTEPIDCEQVYPNTGQLFYAHTGEGIAAQVTCNDNELVITPATSVSNREIENQLLRAQVQFVQDLAGNALWDVNGIPLDTVAWEFTVDRNPLHWNVPAHEQIAYLGEETIIPIELNNIGAAPAYFEFGNLFPMPEWVIAEPAYGEVNSGGSMTIYLHLDPYLNLGEYQSRIFAETPLGDEPLDLTIHAICRPPEWIVEASDYQHSMTITAELSVQGDVSDDIYDRLGAFVGDECRGVADMVHLETTDSVGVDTLGLPIYETTHYFRAFMTAYSDEPVGETLKFRIWDASHCDELWEIETSLPFAANTIVGSLVEPAVLNATGAIAQHIDLSQGWTWFSFNLQYGEMNFNDVFDLLEANAGDRIIAADTAAYAEFADGVGWVGPLTGLPITNTDMYQADMLLETSFPFVGFVIDPDNTAIEMSVGWNRIGYTPQVNMELAEALSGLTPLPNDQIKSQIAFAQYDANYGWYGSLDYLEPGVGYMLHLAQSDTLIYPSGYGRSLDPVIVDESEEQPLLVECPW